MRNLFKACRCKASLKKNIALALMLFVTFGPAQKAQEEQEQVQFAALTVTPFGQQKFDLATNTTTLPQGGKLVDKHSDVTLSGEYVRYQEGVFIELKNAIVEGSFGNLEAPNIELDIATQTLHARGNIRYADDELMIEALSVVYLLEPNIVIVRGEVLGNSPTLEGTSLVIDAELNQALLLGPYMYQDGPFLLSGETQDDLLWVSWQGEGDDFQVTTDIDNEIKERLLNFMNMAKDWAKEEN